MYFWENIVDIGFYLLEYLWLASPVFANVRSFVQGGMTEPFYIAGTGISSRGLQV